MINRTSREELAWAAGLFDGEGHAYTVMTQRSRKMKEKTRMQIGLSIAQSGSREVLDRFQEAVGVGQVLGPYDRGNQPVYNYRVNGFEKTRYVVTSLLPYLSSVKKKQCIDALNRWSEWRKNFVVIGRWPK